MVRGFLHEPPGPPRGAMVLTHGAGSNCEATLLVAAAESFRAGGFVVLRCDLPYRQERAKGTGAMTAPLQARDREGIRRAAEEVRIVAGAAPMILAGHSYGGRQCSMLAAAEPAAADFLLLLSYPLHPAGQPGKLRTAHFAGLRTPALFVSGTRDPLGSIEELTAAIALIPARTKLVPIERGTHSLPPSIAPRLPEWIEPFMVASPK